LIDTKKDIFDIKINYFSLLFCTASSFTGTEDRTRGETRRSKKLQTRVLEARLNTRPVILPLFDPAGADGDPSASFLQIRWVFQNPDLGTPKIETRMIPARAYSFSAIDRAYSFSAIAHGCYC
jgi:hypothetical protein